jgi:protein-S-isoprenylcysteine O-methyltransferase Ste14
VEAAHPEAAGQVYRERMRYQVLEDFVHSHRKDIGEEIMKLKALVGSGEKILLLTAPFLILGLILNFMYPSVFDVGGPSTALRAISIIILIPGVTIWIWSVVLVLLKVPKNELITNGPYALVKHPLYAGVALLVLPWIGFLFNTWLGLVIGIVMYIGSRMFAPEEEELLVKTFGASWDEYCDKVLIPWL